MSVIVLEQHGTHTLAGLAEIANREHAKTGEALFEALKHAVACGDALLEAREQIGASDWVSWAAENLAFGKNQAHRYMRLAFYKEHLPAHVFEPWNDKAGNLRPPSLGRTLPYIKHLPAIFDGREAVRIPEETRQEALRLHKQGVTPKDIALLVGISYDSSLSICDPARAARTKQLAKAAYKRRKAAERALRQAEILEQRRRIAKEAGGPLAEAYSLIRRALQRATEAESGADSEMGEHVKKAISNLHRAEDDIARALRVPEPNIRSYRHMRQ